MAKAVSKKEKPAKSRAANYDEKLAVNGTFEELVKVLITPKPEKKKKK